MVPVQILLAEKQVVWFTNHWTAFEISKDRSLGLHPKPCELPGSIYKTLQKFNKRLQAFMYLDA